MQLKPIQFKLIDRLANSSDGAVLLTIFEDIINEISNIRKLDASNTTPEEVRARQIACTMIEIEIMDRLKIKSKKDEEDLNDYD